MLMPALTRCYRKLDAAANANVNADADAKRWGYNANANAMLMQAIRQSRLATLLSMLPFC